jgi:hypothetical protein
LSPRANTLLTESCSETRHRVHLLPVNMRDGHIRQL